MSDVLLLMRDSGLQRKVAFIAICLSLLFSFIPLSTSQTWYYLGAVGNLSVYLDDDYITRESVMFKFENNYDHSVMFWWYVKHDATGKTICSADTRWDMTPHSVAYAECLFSKECENSVYIKDLYGYYDEETFPIAPGDSKVGTVHVHDDNNCVPEFPLGLPLEILFIPVIVYMLWRSRPKKKVLP